MPCRKFHTCNADCENGWSGIDPEVSDDDASRTRKSSLGRKFLTCSSAGMNCLSFWGLPEFMKDLLACGEHFWNGRKAELFRSTVLQVPNCFEPLLLCMLPGSKKKLPCHVYSFMANHVT